MDNFVAIDFETANREPSSVCSVGIVVVREGKIQNHLYRLIHPTPNYYNYWNTRVHGLTAADTAQAPAFPFVWAEIEPLIGGLPLVAHMTYPEYKFYCTCRASRRVFGKELPNHQLQTVAARCGYQLEHHHHALADAEACAWIALRIMDLYLNS